VSKQSLLLVDGDARSLRVLEVSLRKAGFMVTAASSVQDALDKLVLHAPDLIISETAFPDGDGFELRRRVRATAEWGEIPFIFLTAEAAIENKIRGLELGVDDYLTKPIYIKEIVTRINILLQKRQRVRFEERRDGRTRFAGRVHDMPVVDVIQTIEISRKSGVIQFVGERGRQAAIYFREGKVIDAEAGALQGEDAVYRLLTWAEGEFEVVFRTVRRREVITMSSQALLMEGMRRLDEWSRLFEQLPPLTHRFEVDTGELAARLGDVPDDNNRILRMFDGKRTLLEVIDASEVGDLECLQAISRLYFEELLIDLDHGKAQRRDTGKSMPLVEADAAGSGPVRDANAAAPGAGGGMANAPAGSRDETSLSGARTGDARDARDGWSRAMAAGVFARAATDDAGDAGGDEAGGNEAGAPGARDTGAGDFDDEHLGVPVAGQGTGRSGLRRGAEAADAGPRGASAGGAAGEVAGPRGPSAAAAAGRGSAAAAAGRGSAVAAAGRGSAVAAAGARENADAAGAAGPRGMRAGERDGSPAGADAAATDGSWSPSAAETEGAWAGERDGAWSGAEEEAAATADRTGAEDVWDASANEVDGLQSEAHAEAREGAWSADAGVAGEEAGRAREGAWSADTGDTSDEAGRAGEGSWSADAGDASDEDGRAREGGAAHGDDPDGNERASWPRDEDAYEDDLSDIGPLLGGYRPSSLRLIDEAVAAAQAIEPSLFESAPEEVAPVAQPAGNGVSGHAEDGERGAVDDQADPGAPAMVVAAPLRSAEREDSGLRMIGSLGRDRAEASGELASMGHARPRRSETARELVTILPRRITRELPALVQAPSAELADSLPTPTPTPPVLVPRAPSVPSLDTSAAVPSSSSSSRIPLPGSGVRAPSLARRVLRIVRPAPGSGPGLVALLLFLLAAVLVVTALVLRIRRNARSVQGVEMVQDAPPSAAKALGAEGPATPELPIVRSDPPLPEAPRVAPGGGSAEEAPRASRSGEVAPATATQPPVDRRAPARGDGGPDKGIDKATDKGIDKATDKATDKGIDKATDKATEAKTLLDKGSAALAEGDFQQALALAESSLKLRRTARTFLLRAKAQQRLDRVDDALASVDAAERLAPENGSVWELRGRILWAARRREDARAAFERFLEIEPEGPRAAQVRRLLSVPR
jgi:DNA-binding response OmpR family regulator